MNRKKLIVWLSGFFCMMLIWPLFLFAGTVDLPKTGQATSYAAGDDGDIQAGVNWPEPRFEDNGDGTVTDYLTGLVWLKNAGCAGQRNWNEALNYCNNLASGSCGLTDGSVAGDWRLPNIIELESLVNAEESNSATWLNTYTQGFSNVQSSHYWSATTDAYNPPYHAWNVCMHGHMYSNNKSNSRYVWPVRAGQE